MSRPRPPIFARRCQIVLRMWQRVDIPKVPARAAALDPQRRSIGQVAAQALLRCLQIAEPELCLFLSGILPLPCTLLCFFTVRGLPDTSPQPPASWR
jgi:hypothetical protein